MSFPLLSQIIHVQKGKNIRTETSYAQSYPHYPKKKKKKRGYIPFGRKNSRFVDNDKSTRIPAKNEIGLDIPVVNKLDIIVLFFDTFQTIVFESRA